MIGSTDATPNKVSISGPLHPPPSLTVEQAGPAGPELNRRLISLALSRVDAAELAELYRLAERAVKGSDRYTENDRILGLVRDAGRSTAGKTLSLLLSRTWRNASMAPDVTGRTGHLKELVRLRELLADACLVRSKTDVGVQSPPSMAPAAAAPSCDEAIFWVYEKTVGRGAVPEEIEIWKNHFQNGLSFHEFLLSMANSPEAARHGGAKGILLDRSDGAFIQSAYELIHGRGAKAWEIAHWVSRLVSGAMQRSDVLVGIFTDAVRYRESDAAHAVHDGLSCKVMGTPRFVTLDDWRERAQVLVSEPAPPPDERYAHRFHIKGPPRVLVSAIASLYKGGDFIEQFMDNITAQRGFDDYCELIIVDADSPDGEADVISRYLAKHEGIRYLRVNYRIGIYDAWNLGVKAAQGEYLTNTNLDDLRRVDSFELQAAVLENLPFVDITYQDFYYTFDPRLPFDEIARYGYESNLPIVTPHNMMEFNSPHNAPMWRRRLHDELGYFNTHYRSAGDYDFWLRCLAAGKCFYKLNDPHVVYYQNPKGLSTRSDTRGVIEAKEILSDYGRALVSPNLTMPLMQFRAECLPGVPEPMTAGLVDRYALAQLGLRMAARALKFAGPGGVRP